MLEMNQQLSHILSCKDQDLSEEDFSTLTNMQGTVKSAAEEFQSSKEVGKQLLSKFIANYVDIVPLIQDRMSKYSDKVKQYEAQIAEMSKKLSSTNGSEVDEGNDNKAVESGSLEQDPEEDLSGNDKEVLQASQKNRFAEDENDEIANDTGKDDDNREHAHNEDTSEQGKFISQEDVVDEPKSN